MNKQMQGVLLILAYEVLIGVSPIVTRTISNELSSGLLVFARYGIGSVVLLAAVLSSKQLSRELVSLPAKLAMGLVLLGILGSGLASALYVVAIRQAGAVVATFVANLEIPLGIGLAALIMGEKLTSKYIKVVSLVLLGFVLLVGIDKMGLQWAAIGAAIVWGVCTVLGKIILDHKIAPIIVALVRILVGSVFGLVLGWGSWPDLSLIDWAYLAFLGIVVSAGGTWIYYLALQRLTVKKIAPFFTGQIMVTTVLGIMTGEVLNWQQWVGMGFIAGGLVWLAKQEEEYDAIVN